MKKAALHNLGCKVNSYETEAMQQLLELEGYEIVPFAQKADVYIINTCTVTNIADRKSRQMLHKAKKLNPEAIVIAAGCYVQAAKETLEMDDAIDIVIGNNRKGNLISILKEYEDLKECKDKRVNVESVIDINHTNEYESLSIGRSFPPNEGEGEFPLAEHSRAFIKVQDGCNQFCSYCIIPYARGRVRSRSSEDVEAEVRSLSGNGYQEIVLTGIHLSSYGVDFLLERQENLLDLIVKLHNIDGVKRIRLGSLEPRIITDEFVKTLAGLEKFCPHFHLSLQSGCNDVLKRMNRRYTAEEYYEKCRILKKYFSEPGITTDVIVGFPGETEEEFRITKDFATKTGFSTMHVFKYSKREGTKAAAMEGQVAEQVKTARSNILLELGKKMSMEFRERYIGREVEILLEEEAEINGQAYLIGHTKEFIKAAILVGEGKPQEIVTAVPKGHVNDEILLCKRIL